MQKFNIKTSKRVINLQKFIIQNFPKANEVGTLNNTMMEIVLREANNSEENIIEEMIKDMAEINGLSIKNPVTEQKMLETVCGAYHFTEFYNGLYNVMIHFDDILWYVYDASADKYKRKVLYNDFDELDLDLTNIVTSWFGAVFSTKIDKIFNKYIVDRGHYDTIYGLRFPNDSSPLSQQMKMRSVFLLVITVVTMMSE